MDINIDRNTSGIARGLNICWNHFDKPLDPEMEDFLARVHIGDTISDCNKRELAEIGANLSGSWYDPSRNGKGYSIMLLDSGQLLYYWFGYPNYMNKGPQKWAFQLVEPDRKSASLPRAHAPWGGRFDQGLGDGTLSDIDRRSVEMVRLIDDRLSISTHSLPGSRYVIIDPPRPAIQDRSEHVRLTELAGTTCDNQHLEQDLSGLWYNPERDGEGFVLEILPDGRALLYWFTFHPDDSGVPAWIIGVGQVESLGGYTPGVTPPGTPMSRIDIDQLTRPVGGVLGPNFDSEAIEHVDWGSLRLDFGILGGEGGHVYWDSISEDYGFGDYPIERLARPMLAECE